MLADCQAMMVDAMTYLFNMCAERIKNRPHSESDLSEAEQDYKRNLQRLYLELFPPLISVTCLIAVTISTIQDASESLWGKHDADEVEEVVSLKIMLIFSALNLVLDIVNVTCFARANMNFGLDVVGKEARDIRQSVQRRLSGDASVTEASSLLALKEVVECEHESLINLNMCSAWTVSVTMFLLV